MRTSLALEEARKSQARAEESLQQARQAVDDLFTRVSEDTLLNQPGMQPLRRDLLRRARDYYEKFLKQSQGDTSLRDELAMAQFRVGLITEEVESPGKAIPSYETARDIQTQLVGGEPTNPDRLKALGDTLNAIGRALHKQQQPEQALKAYAAALDVRKRLAERVPDNMEFQRTLANTYMNIGLAEKEGDLAQARKSMEQAQTIRNKLLAAGQHDAKLRRDFAMGCFNLAMLALAGNDADAAEAALEKARQLFAALVKDVPNDIDTSYVLAVCCRKQADLLCPQETVRRSTKPVCPSAGCPGATGRKEPVRDGIPSRSRGSLYQYRPDRTGTRAFRQVVGCLRPCSVAADSAGGRLGRRRPVSQEPHHRALLRR